MLACLHATPACVLVAALMNMKSLVMSSKRRKKRESGNHLISVQKENMVIAIDHLFTFVWSRTTPLDEPFSTVYICPTKEALR
jgi:hypothetical protein